MKILNSELIRNEFGTILQTRRTHGGESLLDSPVAETGPFPDTVDRYQRLQHFLVDFGGAPGPAQRPDQRNAAYDSFGSFHGANNITGP